MKLVALLLATLIATTHAGEVRITKKGEGWQLLRDGQPYLVKGGGGSRELASIARAGGNSVRLWGDEGLGETLDSAQKLGLTVCAGIWLGQVRQGFKWNDPASLERQQKHVREVVEKYRQHPALLCWALGNEMEDPQGKNTDVWKGIESLAAMVKQIDPNHPTMTVVAEIGGEKVQNIHKLCPSLDLVGINSYAGSASLPERYRKAGGAKPYLLTEYGPAGVWESQRDALGAYPEPTSTAKAETYRRAYTAAVLGAPDLCLGSYAFLWGQKQEVTATWFSLFLEDGSRLAGVDAIGTLWGGKPPEHPCPAIESLKIDGTANGKPGDTIRAKLQASGPGQEPLKVEWYFQQDPGEYGNGNDAQSAGPILHEVIVKGDLTGAEIKLPADGGLYRLFAIVRDTHGGAAAANTSIRVDGPKTMPTKGMKAKLPLRLYGEAGDPATYIPAGWMGDTKSIQLDPDNTTQPHTGRACLRCEFSAAKGWGGVVWQNPANDWGSQGGGYDLTGAKRVTFWARGEQGGEVVSFEYGILEKGKRFADTGSGSLPKVKLTKEWERYEIPAAGQDLTRIKTGFVWTTQGAGSPVVFYLDDVQWE